MSEKRRGFIDKKKTVSFCERTTCIRPLFGPHLRTEIEIKAFFITVRVTMVEGFF